MMTTEIKINGRIIGIMYLHNEGPYFSLKDEEEVPIDTYEYYWEYTPIPRGKKMTGQILHIRAEGAEVLVHKIFGEIIKGYK